MKPKLYPMPIRFDMLMERNPEVPVCTPGTSIAQHIFLIVTCMYNEHRFDPDYGCEIWSRDFELITNPLAWQEQVNKSIITTITRYERRLEYVEVDTSITEEAYRNPITRVHSIKKKITIYVKGTIKETGEPFSYAPQLFLSPISID